MCMYTIAIEELPEDWEDKCKELLKELPEASPDWETNVQNCY